ncbi:MAG: bile acid:sodium symporter [Planctomycetota bacterium]
MFDFLRQQSFLILLVSSMIGGFLLAEPLRFVADSPWLRWTVVALTMTAMTWPLQSSTLMAASRKPTATLLATSISLILAPLFAWPLSQFLNEEFGSGLVIAAAVPSTLASAAVWTRRAGGNDSIAIMVTIATNLSCFILTPLWVYWLTGIHWPEGSLSGIIIKLLMFVVTPMAIGQLLRIPTAWAQWADQNKSNLSRFAQTGILIMVLIGSIRMGLGFHQSDYLTAGVAWEIIKSMVFVFTIHIALLFIGLWAGKITGQSREDQIAIAFSGSQKTLMVGLSTAVSLGLNIIPIVAYHALQLIVDTIVADRLKSSHR